MDFQLVFAGLLGLCCLYAFVRGGTPERLAAMIVLSGSLLSVALLSAEPTRFRSVEVGVLAVDLCMLAAFIVLALRAERFWPIWVAALHLADMLAHLAKAASPTLNPRAYAIFEIAGSYLILVLIIIGTRRHHVRLKRFGADKSWSSFSTASTPATQGSGPTG